MSMHYEFENVADAFAHMKMMEEQANARVVEKQREVTWGSYWVQPRGDIGIIIFGYAMTEEEIRTGELECGADEGEVNATLSNLRAAHERGYRFSRAYSVVEPEGELGDCHISRCWPITEEQFREAEVLGWESKAILHECGWLADALIDFTNSQSR